MQVNIKTTDPKESKRLIYSLELTIFSFEVLRKVPKNLETRQEVTEWIASQWEELGLPPIYELID